MRTVRGGEVTDMVEYLEEVRGHGDSGDVEYVDEVNTEGVCQYGRRVLEWFTTGRHDVHTFPSKDHATKYVEDWNLDRFSPADAFETRRVCRVDLSYFGGEGVVEYRNYPKALTVNIYLDGREVDVFTLGEPVPDFESFEVECREHFAHSDFVSEG